MLMTSLIGGGVSYQPVSMLKTDILDKSYYVTFALWHRNSVCLYVACRLSVII